MNRLTGGDPTTRFSIVFILSIPAVFVVGATEAALLGLGGSAGGLFAAAWGPCRNCGPDSKEYFSLGSGRFVTAIRGLESVVGRVEPLLIVLYAVLLAGISFAPAAVGRLDLDAFQPPGS
ncbi:hypothetical protein [Natrinema halophilum]|uniref:hypothetical protein n=1 Tax=Natrinema halophilum TaxID=1699371 RepID=UPI0031BA24A7